MSRRKIRLERTFAAPLEDVWELWTSKEGIESWWGPDGFRVEVRQLDLRPGGELHYGMIATAPAQVEFMRNAGMPLTNEVRAKFTEVVPRRRLAFTQLADFVPGVEPYEMTTAVELSPFAQGVRMLVTLDAMHDEIWTQRAVAGMESQLGRLAKLIEGRS